MKKMLNRVCVRQLPCGTPVLIVKVVEGVDFQVTWKVRSFKKSLTQFSRRCGRLAFWSLWMIPWCEALSKAFLRSNRMQPVYCVFLNLLIWAGLIWQSDLGSFCSSWNRIGMVAVSLFRGCFDWTYVEVHDFEFVLFIKYFRLVHSRFLDFHFFDRFL